MTHPSDRLSANRPPACDEPDPIGTEPGDTCNRYAEPDEDAPRGYRPKPRQGEMVITRDGVTFCNTCRETK